MVMVWLQRVVEGNDVLARYDADESSEDELVRSPPISPCKYDFL